MIYEFRKEGDRIIFARQLRHGRSDFRASIQPRNYQEAARLVIKYFSFVKYLEHEGNRVIVTEEARKVLVPEIEKRLEEKITEQLRNSQNPKLKEYAKAKNSIYCEAMDELCRGKSKYNFCNN